MENNEFQGTWWKKFEEELKAESLRRGKTWTPEDTKKLLKMLKKIKAEKPYIIFVTPKLGEEQDGKI